jgi:hypothetical protein
MIASIRFGIERISDKNALDGTVVDFGVVVILNKNKGAATNFAKVRQVRT